MSIPPNSAHVPTVNLDGSKRDRMVGDGGFGKISGPRSPPPRSQHLSQSFCIVVFLDPGQLYRLRSLALLKHHLSPLPSLCLTCLALLRLCTSFSTDRSPGKMDFLKDAEQFESDNQGGNTGNQGGNAQPGSGQDPSDSQLYDSAKTLYGAATGQQVDHQQLAGAAGDLLGGLASHDPSLDQGQDGTYVNDAEQYLDKYSGGNQGAGGGAPGGASANPSAAQGADGGAGGGQGTDDSSGYGAGGGGGQGTDDSSGYGGGGGQGTDDSSGYGAGGGGGGQGGDGYGGGQGTGGSSW